VEIHSEGLFGGELEDDNERKLEDMFFDMLEEKQPPRSEIEKFFKVEVRQFFKGRYGLRPEVIVLVHHI
jgi:hypothetical protein